MEEDCKAPTRYKYRLFPGVFLPYACLPNTMETTNVEKMTMIVKVKKTMKMTSGMVNVMLLPRNLQPLGSLLPKAAEPF